MGVTSFIKRWISILFTAMDVYSHYTWMYPLSHKSDALCISITFKNKVENFTGHKMKVFESNNRGKKKKFTPYLGSQGISLYFSCPCTSAQNTLAKRRHRHIVKMGLSLLNHASVPLTFWVESFTTACYLINQLPASTVVPKSPLELFFGTKPNYHALRVFGS